MNTSIVMNTSMGSNASSRRCRTRRGLPEFGMVSRVLVSLRIVDSVQVVATDAAESCPELARRARCRLVVGCSRILPKSGADVLRLLGIPDLASRRFWAMGQCRDQDENGLAGGSDLLHLAIALRRILRLVTGVSDAVCNNQVTHLFCGGKK